MRLNSFKLSNRAQLIFFCGALLFLAVKISFVIISEFSRALPVEPDDSLVYLTRATQSQTCPSLDCPAYNSLNQQIRESSDSTFNNAKNRLISLVFLNQTYGYTSALKVLMPLTESPLFAIKFLRILSIIFIGIATVIFAHSLGGPFPAGISLAILSFYNFNAQGLIIPVPSNISLAISMLAFAVTIETERLHWISFPLLVVAMLFHPIGKIMSLQFCLTMGLYFFIAKDIFKTSQIIGVLFFLGLSIWFILFPNFLEPSGAISVNLIDNQLNSTFFQKVLFNIKAASGGWNFNSLCLFFVLSGVLVLSLWHPKISKIKKCFLISMLMVTYCSVLYYIPNYPGELFFRVIIIFAFTALPITILYCDLHLKTLRNVKFYLILFMVVVYSSFQFNSFLSQLKARTLRNNFSVPGFLFQASTQDCTLITDHDLPLLLSLAIGPTQCQYQFSKLKTHNFSQKVYFFGLNPVNEVALASGTPIKIRFYSSSNSNILSVFHQNSGLQISQLTTSDTLSLARYTQILYLETSEVDPDAYLQINGRRIYLDPLKNIPEKLQVAFPDPRILHKDENFIFIELR